MKNRRVVITGLGVVSPVGSGVKFAWENIKAGKSGIRKIDTFDVSDLASQIAGYPVAGTGAGEYDQESVIDQKNARKMDKSVAYGVVAAVEAIKDAGIDEGLTDAEKDRTGVYIGAGIGGLQTIYENCVALEKEGPRRVSPFFIPKALINMMSGHVSMMYGFRGPNMAAVTACASATHSIGDAARFIQHGDADIMIAGGSESAVCRIGIAGFAAMHALSTRNDDPEHASRPWDKGRDGFVIGEGAGALVLEEFEHAKARGAKIYGEIFGFGMSGDAHHITAPAEDGNGGLRAMQAALRDAEMEPKDIDYINAHGTSTPLGDLAEFNAVKTLFAGTNVSMSSTKSMTGHLLGAAGAIEAVFSVMALNEGICPPTINLEDPADEVAGFDLVPNVAKEKIINNVLSNSFGFGGTNASIIIGKPR